MHVNWGNFDTSQAQAYNVQIAATVVNYHRGAANTITNHNAEVKYEAHRIVETFVHESKCRLLFLRSWLHLRFVCVFSNQQQKTCNRFGWLRMVCGEKPHARPLWSTLGIRVIEPHTDGNFLCDKNL